MNDGVKELVKMILNWIENRNEEYMADIDFRHKLHKFILTSPCDPDQDDV
jgi:hypothetical protein